MISFINLGWKSAKWRKITLVCWWAVIRTDSARRHLISGRPGRARSEAGQRMWSAQGARTMPGTVTDSGQQGLPDGQSMGGNKRRAGQVILVTEALEPLGASAAWTQPRRCVCWPAPLPSASPGCPSSQVPRRFSEGRSFFRATSGQVEACLSLLRAMLAPSLWSATCRFVVWFPEALWWPWSWEQPHGVYYLVATQSHSNMLSVKAFCVRAEFWVPGFL